MSKDNMVFTRGRVLTDCADAQCAAPLTLTEPKFKIQGNHGGITVQPGFICPDCGQMHQIIRGDIVKKGRGKTNYAETPPGFEMAERYGASIEVVERRVVPQPDRSAPVFEESSTSNDEPVFEKSDEQEQEKEEQPIMPTDESQAVSLDDASHHDLGKLCKHAGITPIPSSKEDRLAALKNHVAKARDHVEA